MQRLSPEQVQTILDLYESGLSGEAVAAQTGWCSPHTVRYHAKAAGLLRERDPICPRRHDEIVRWCQEGLSLTEMASRLPTKRAVLKRYILGQRIPWSPYEQTGANNPAWRGGRMTDKHGYILILRPGHPQANRHGYVREHRVVMEELLGRPLTRKEVVDHIDGDPSNNDPKNLRLFASNGEHLRATTKGVPCPARANRYGPTPRGRGRGGRPLPGKTRLRLVAHGTTVRLPCGTVLRPAPDQPS